MPSTSRKSNGGAGGISSEQGVLEKLLPRLMKLEGRLQCVQINAKRIVKTLNEVAGSRSIGRG